MFTLFNINVRVLDKVRNLGTGTTLGWRSRYDPKGGEVQYN